MRNYYVLCAALALGACHYASDNGANSALAHAEAEANADAADEGHIDCALAGAREFSRVCAVDREEGPKGLVLVMRHPDGGFHRLLVTKDGRGVIAADGAQGAQVTIVGPDLIEVRIAGDRYRLPATVAKPKA